MTRPIFCSALSLLLVAFASPSSTQAASFDWLGGSGTNWTTAANWTLTAGGDADGVPDADDDVRLPATAVYTGGIGLNGDQACNSLTYSNNVAITLGRAGETLTITSGSLTRKNVGGVAIQHKITCNLQLNAPNGTNVFDVAGGEAYNVPTQEVLVEGRITAAGILCKTGAVGKLTLANTNSFGGPVVLDGGILEVKGVPVASAVGAGTIALDQGTRFQARDLSQTVTNAFAVSAAGTAPIVASYNCTLVLAANIDVPTGRPFQYGMSGSSLVILSNQVTGTGSLTVMRAAVAFNATNQFTPANLNVGQSGGTVILDGVPWATFTNYYSAGYGTGNRQWQLNSGGFAARGSAPLTITGVGSVGGGADAKTWFNRTVAFGGYWDTPSLAYANSPVVVQVNTEFSARNDWTSSGNGPGLYGTHSTARINAYNGNITDQVAAGTGANRGSLRFSIVQPGDEMILRGTNNWTGSYYMNGITGPAGTMDAVNTGPGGMVVYCSGVGTGFIQFDGNDALPRGNGGNAAWLAAVSRYGGYVGYGVAARSGGETYALPSGFKLMLGTTPNGVLAASGAAGSSAILRDSAVCLHMGLTNAASTAELLARGPCEFQLGIPGAGTNGAVLFQPSWYLDPAGADHGLAGVATLVSNSPAPRTLRTRGDGTLVLGNVQYTLVDGSGDTHTQFVWQVGLRSGSTFFDGAVRETGTDLWNSVAALPLSLDGGVLELGYTNVARGVTNVITAGMIAWTYGGGFSAHGAPRRVRLDNGRVVDWNNVYGMPASTYPITFGSRTANDTLILENDVRLNGGIRTFLTVRGTGTTPEGRLEGRVYETGGFILNNAKTQAGEPIPAGALELASTNNGYSGTTTISNGTLLVAGVLLPAAAQVNVIGGALGGTGIIYRVVNVASNAALSPGNLNSVGTLTIASNVTLAAGAIYNWDYSDGASDRVVVGRTLTLPANVTVNANVAGGVLAAPGILFSANQLAGATNTLSGWTLVGLNDTHRLKIVGSEVRITPPPRGTMFFVR